MSEQSLPSLVRNRLAELNISPTEAARRSQGLVSAETLRLIARGAHNGQLRSTVPQGIALALEVPLADVLAAAGMPERHGRWDWPHRFDVLDPHERRVVESVAASIMAAKEKAR